MGSAPVKAKQSAVRRTFRLLGNKEKKELRAYAHQLGDDICVHQVGKWGVTANVVTAISDASEANELIKVRVLDNLADEMEDTVRNWNQEQKHKLLALLEGPCCCIGLVSGSLLQHKLPRRNYNSSREEPAWVVYLQDGRKGRVKSDKKGA